MLGQLRKVVDLLPGEDALAVRLAAGKQTRGRTGGDQDDIRAVALLTIVRADDEPVRTHEPAAAVHDFDALARQSSGDVERLRQGEGLHPRVDGAERDGYFLLR